MVENCVITLLRILYSQMSCRKVQRNSSPGRQRLLEHHGCGSNVLQRHPRTVKDDNFVLRYSTCLLPRDHFTQLCVDVRRVEQSGSHGMMQVADGCTLLSHIAQ